MVKINHNIKQTIVHRFSVYKAMDLGHNMWGEYTESKNTGLFDLYWQIADAYHNISHIVLYLDDKN